jgi:3-phytase
MSIPDRLQAPARPASPRARASRDSFPRWFPARLVAAFLVASPAACSDAGNPFEDTAVPSNTMPVSGSANAPDAPVSPPSSGLPATPDPGYPASGEGGDVAPPLAPPAGEAPIEVPDDEDPDSPSSASVVTGRVVTASVDDYDDAPGSPDPDDPAVWLDPEGSGAAFIFGTLKEGGMLVFGVDGRVLQTIVPPQRPLVSALDPFTPIGVGAASAPCPDSTTGEEFGRFNNVHVQYGFELTGPDGETRTIDIAVVSDRGCDNLRIYEIDPSRAGGPLIDITDAGAPRLFPTRFEQPSPIQSPGALAVEAANPLEDANTAYGMTTFRLDDDAPVFAMVSQNNRGVIGQFELIDTGAGTVSYEPVREFRFSPIFGIEGPGSESIAWSPCREEVDEDLQFEGLVVDTEEGVLYAAQEVVGIWRVDLDDEQPAVVTVPEEFLLEKTLDFGAPFFAVPNEDGEFSCESSAPEAPPSGTIAGPGALGVGGEHLAADVEGLAIYDAGDGEGYLVASSQGDNTFHIFDREDVTAHLGTFSVEGAGETDGHELISLPLGPQFPQGALIIQNGGATPPADTSAINGFEYDGSGNFVFIAWEDVAELFDLTIASPEDVLD